MTRYGRGELATRLLTLMTTAEVTRSQTIRMLRDLRQRQPAPG